MINFSDLLYTYHTYSFITTNNNFINLISVLYNIDSAVLLFYNTIIHTHTHILGTEMLLKIFTIIIIIIFILYDHADLQ